MVASKALSVSLSFLTVLISVEFFLPQIFAGQIVMAYHSVVLRRVLCYVVVCSDISFQNYLYAL